MDGKVLARIAAIIFIAVAITAAIIEMTREDKTAPMPASSARQPTIDPLRAELRRCQRIGEAAAHDAGCLRVWSQNRDRFLDRAPALATPATSERP